MPVSLHKPSMWLALGALAALCGVGALLQWQARGSARMAANESTLTAARLGAQAVSIWLDERRADADVTAASPMLQDAVRPGPALHEYLELIRSRYGYRAIVLLDLETHRPLLQTGPIAYNLAQLDGLLPALKDGVMRWVEIAGDDGRYHMGLLHAVGSGARPARRGLFFEFDPQRLGTLLQGRITTVQGMEMLLQAPHPQSAGRYFLLRPEGFIEPAPRGTRSTGAPVEYALGQDAYGQVAGADYQGQLVFAHGARVPGTPWTVIAMQAQAQAYARTQREGLFTIPILAGLWVISLLLIRLWHRGETFRTLARETKLTRHHQMLFQHAGDAIFTLREDGHIIDANEAAARMYGYALTQFPGMHIRELRPPEGRAAQAAQRAKDKIGQSRNFLAEHQRADGSRFMAEVTASTSELDGKRLQHSVVRDVTARQQIETQLRVAASFFERSNAAVLIADAEGRVQTVNAAYTRLTGFSTEDLSGRPWAGLQESLAQADASAKRHGYDALQIRQFWEGEFQLMRKNGQSYPARVILNGYLDKRGRIEQYVMVHTDLSIIRNAQSQLQYAATRDQLTGLPNRTQLEQQLEVQVQQAEAGNSSFVFVMLNLDHWRSINDSIGYSTADQLLHLVAERLSLLVPGPEAVYRFGGDEFGLLLTGEQADNYGALLDSLLLAMVHPLQLGPRSFQLTVSMGASLCPSLGRTRDDLITQASTALRVAKQQGRNTWRLYNTSMSHSSYEDLALLQDLRQAVARGELSLALQPQYTTDSLRLVGMEALLRWRHPTRGVIPPSTFIPMAETSGLIVEMGRWVLHEACRLWSSWQAQGLMPPCIAVNLSTLQFHQAQLVNEVAEALRRHDLPAGALELEITESLLMSDVDVAIGRMRELVNMGIRLSIDDFGTGYSSLSYLRRFPVHKLKIDRSFVNDLAQDDGAIAVAVIRMAKSLGLVVIAEGVETEAQLAFLREHGCDEIQGYLLARPMPAEDLPQLLRGLREQEAAAALTQIAH